MATRRKTEARGPDGPGSIEAIWAEAREALSGQMGARDFDRWIAPLTLQAIDGAVARLQAPTSFAGSYVQRTYGELIAHHLRRAGVPVQRLTFGAAGGPRPVAAVAAPASAPLPAGPELPDAVDRRATFARFVPGTPNAMAHAAARRVAEGGDTGFNPLYIYGGVGFGKTHLLHAIANRLRERAPRTRVLYLTAEQFMYRFVQSLREHKVIEFKALVRSVDVLLIDDIQFIAGKESTQEEFVHTFNALIEAGKQVVVASSHAPGALKGIDERIRSRLGSGLAVDLKAADESLRLDFAQSRIAEHVGDAAEIEVEDAVAPFLAGRITQSLRALDGALTRLFAFAGIMDRAVSLEMTQECLSDLLRDADRRVTIEDIQRRVAEHYDIRPADITGPRRTRAVARPRQVAMWLAKRMTQRSLPDIGRRFGGRDHTTILHGVRVIEDLRLRDPNLAQDLEELSQALQG
ncbi:MAG: chromosomal replication initiator protein DnaA [Paracoccaceae bacterium]